ncbi:MAG TPA: YbdD/YjiX family protein [Gemmatimonadaceae bacterium]|nr:YbdD/YjiX family protein [Gemmatimonadaceae bacterium]
MTIPRWYAGLRTAAAKMGRALRAVIGAPDYELYVAHTRTAHPGRAVVDRGEFERRRLDDRYSRPGARCC